MAIIMEWLGRAEAQTAVLVLVALVFGLVKRLQAVKRWRLTRVLEYLEAGVRVTYEEYVRAMKEGSLDGKLTDAERREARRRALDRAKQYATEDGIDMLKVYAKEYLPVLVERIITRDKGAILPFVSLFGPELD